MQVLKGVSFTLEAGTSAGLVGPSGGGKSTVMVIQKHWAAFALWGCCLWACIEHRTCAHEVQFGLVPALVGKASCDVSKAMIQRVWASFVPIRLQSIILYMFWAWFDVSNFCFWILNMLDGLSQSKSPFIPIAFDSVPRKKQIHYIQ